MVDATFQWEDGECAYCSEIKCKCGHNIEVERAVNSYREDTVVCPKCGREYEFSWVGMVVEEANDA